MTPHAETWQSGWLGIDYGGQTHGFVDLSIGADGAADALIHRLAGDGEIYSSFRLRLDPEHRQVDLLENVSAEFMAADDEDADDPEWGWTVDATAAVPPDLAVRFSIGSPPAQVFTAMASLHADMFAVLDDAGDLDWDHHGHPGPDPDRLWQPVTIEGGPSPFATRSGQVSVSDRPGLRQIRHASGPDGTGHLADLGSMHLFVTTQSDVWTPVFLPDQLAAYQQGETVDLDHVEPATRDVLLAKIAFLSGPRPTS
ncbi:hypothetical protein WY02_05690 [Pseudonocardia sp. AL041005-10]|nr:hypothetical protein [Pseudonocardia sp. AL041005-10]ALE78007.1 hypothetical protein WY02_05690 [Pseudonocardia sp. AL041005-10]